MLKTKQQFTGFIFGIFLFIGSILQITIFAQDYEDSPFGIMNPYNDPCTASENIKESGIRWTRLGAQGLVWDEEDWSNPDWTKADEVINRAINDSLYIELPPATPLNTPENWDNYEQFIEDLVNRYKDRVKYYQVGNELNGMWIRESGTEFVPKAIADYLVRTYNVIKDNCPDCKVVFGVLNSWPADYYTGCTNRRFCVQDLYSEIINHPEFKGQAFDALDFHWFGKKNEYRFIQPKGADEATDMSILIKDMRNDFKNYNINAELWITESGTHSDIPSEPDRDFQSEKEQAVDLIKRYVYPISLGVKKVFWVTLTEWYEYGGEDRANGFFDNIGLINNPKNILDLDSNYNPKSWKKLSYYTYKLMTEKLEGSDWDSITTVIDSIDNKYAYKFINDSTGVLTYTAWWDYFDDPTYAIGDSSLITLTGISSNQVIVTNAVPTDTTGATITDYNTAFSIDTLNVSGGSISFYLKESPVFIEEISNTSIEETGSITPNEFQLNQNYPNPFNPQTTISYQLPVNGNVALKIYNMLGQEVRTLINKNKPAGYHSVVWDGTDNSGRRVSSGVYFYSLKSDNNFSLTKKLLLLK